MALTFPEPIEWFTTSSKDGKLYVDGLRLMADATSEVSAPDVQAQFEKQAGRMSLDLLLPDAPHPVAANTVTFSGPAEFKLTLHEPIEHTAYLERYGGVDIVISVGTTQETLHLSYADAEALLAERLTDVEQPTGEAPVVVDTPLAAQVDDTITCTTGNWNGEPTSYAYQWQKDGTDVAGDATYVVTAGDAGATFHCKLTATNAYGSTDATSNDVVATGPVADDTARQAKADAQAAAEKAAERAEEKAEEARERKAEERRAIKEAESKKRR